MMKERPLLVIGICVGAILSACSTPAISKSRFLTSFSAADVIKRSYAQPDPQQQLRISEVENSSALGSRGTGHRYCSVDLSISKSDEGQFLANLKREIEKQIEKSGGKVAGGGSGDSGYSISYTDGNAIGWIDIVGMRGAGDGYRLAIITTEK